MKMRNNLRENLAIFKENDKRIWRCINEMTRILQDLDVFSFGGPMPMASMALIYKMTLDCVVGRGGTVNT